MTNESIIACLAALREEMEIDDRLLFPCLRRLHRKRSHRYHVTKGDDTLSHNDYDMITANDAMINKTADKHKNTYRHYSDYV